MKIHIHGFTGMGDHLYLYPFVCKMLEEKHEVWLASPWRELYDITITNPASRKRLHIVKPSVMLRTQGKNSKGYEWTSAPKQFDKHIEFKYEHDDLKTHNITRIIERQTGLLFNPSINPKHFVGSKSRTNVWTTYQRDLLFKLGNPNPKRLVIVKPPTVRAEWACPSRNPKWEYLKYATEELNSMGYRTISVADTDGKYEKLVGGELPATYRFNHGELSYVEILTLASMGIPMVGGVGWNVPMWLLFNSPQFIVFGGRGLYDQMSRIVDPRQSALEDGNVHFALPDQFCRCSSSTHKCNKVISGFPETFHSFVSSIVGR